MTGFKDVNESVFQLNSFVTDQLKGLGNQLGENYKASTQYYDDIYALSLKDQEKKDDIISNLKQLRLESGRISLTTKMAVLEHDATSQMEKNGFLSNEELEKFRQRSLDLFQEHLGVVDNDVLEKYISGLDGKYQALELKNAKKEVKDIALSVTSPLMPISSTKDMINAIAGVYNNISTIKDSLGVDYALQRIRSSTSAWLRSYMTTNGITSAEDIHKSLNIFRKLFGKIGIEDVIDDYDKDYKQTANFLELNEKNNNSNASKVVSDMHTNFVSSMMGTVRGSDGDVNIEKFGIHLTTESIKSHIHLLKDALDTIFNESVAYGENFIKANPKISYILNGLRYGFINPNELNENTIVILSDEQVATSKLLAQRNIDSVYNQDPKSDLINFGVNFSRMFSDAFNQGAGNGKLFGFIDKNITLSAYGIGGVASILHNTVFNKSYRVSTNTQFRQFILGDPKKFEMLVAKGIAEGVLNFENTASKNQPYNSSNQDVLDYVYGEYQKYGSIGVNNVNKISNTLEKINSEFSDKNYLNDENFKKLSDKEKKIWVESSKAFKSMNVQKVNNFMDFNDIITYNGGVVAGTHGSLHKILVTNPDGRLRDIIDLNDEKQLKKFLIEQYTIAGQHIISDLAKIKKNKVNINTRIITFGG